MTSELTSILNLRVARLMHPNELDRVQSEMEKLPGIVALEIIPGLVIIEYYQQMLSQERIIQILEELGLSFIDNTKKTSVLSRFIKRLGQANNKEFGGNPPHCCE